MASVGMQSQSGDRWLIFAQLALGAALVVFGALLATFSKSSVHDIATAVIGVGAALLPAGAAASATARLSRPPEQAPPGGASSGQQ